MKCIIVDDNSDRAGEFCSLIEKHFSRKLLITGRFGWNPEDLTEVQDQFPDIVFLGIGENFKDELFFSKQIPDPEFDIILLTDRLENLLHCLRMGAFDYMIRPFSENALHAILTRLENRHIKTPLKNWVFDIIRNMRSNVPVFQKVPIPLQDGYQFEDPSEIVYAEAEESYCHLHFMDDRHLLVSRSLIQMQKLLPSSHFYRIHKSYLINLNLILRYHRNNGLAVTMKNGVTLPVAVRRNEAFLKRIKLP